MGVVGGLRMNINELILGILIVVMS